MTAPVQPGTQPGAELSAGLLPKELADTAVPYDFRRPRRVSKDRQRALEGLYERMIKGFEHWMYSRLRGPIEVRLVSVEQVTFGEFQGTLPNPCVAYAFDIVDSGNQQGIVNIGASLAFLSVERFFGGSGDPTIPERSLTGVERNVVKTLSEKLLQLLAEVWRDYVPMAFEVSGYESLPEMLQIANSDDPVLVAKISVLCGTIESEMAIGLPLTVLDKFFSNSNERRGGDMAGTASEREANRRHTERNVRQTSANVRALLPDFTVTLEDLANLKVGDILPSPHAITTLLNVTIEDQPQFRGEFVTQGTNNAVNLTVQSSRRRG